MLSNRDVSNAPMAPGANHGIRELEIHEPYEREISAFSRRKREKWKSSAQPILTVFPSASAGLA
jgi:hypothetical protein